MRDYHYGVYIGRFQPLHVGHEHVIQQALDHVDTLIIVVGSSYIARTPVNPFTFEERHEMIRTAFSHEVASGRLIILPLYDYEDDNVWRDELLSTVNTAILHHGNNRGVRLHGLKDFKVALAGFGKDASSFYLNMFPDWSSVQIDTQHGTINASDIRSDYFRRLPRLPHDAVNPKLLMFLKNFTYSHSFKLLVKERERYEADQAEYGVGPFMCADALVTWRNKVLLVTRGGDLGHGLLAMPGGFVNIRERTFDACLRELNEETTLDGSDWIDHLAGEVLAENPNRSLRGRVYSKVYYFAIPHNVELAKPVGSDDAKHAAWHDFAKLPTDQFFDDHHSIISNLLSEVHL